MYESLLIIIVDGNQVNCRLRIAGRGQRGTDGGCPRGGKNLFTGHIAQFRLAGGAGATISLASKLAFASVGFHVVVLGPNRGLETADSPKSASLKRFSGGRYHHRRFPPVKFPARKFLAAWCKLRWSSSNGEG